MNKAELLTMTFKEIEKFLNSGISNLSYESLDNSEIKRKMIDAIKHKFEVDISIQSPYYTNSEIILHIDRLHIAFKVSTKITGKTEQVSRLKKQDVKKVGAFKFSNAYIDFCNPPFESVDLEKYIVKISETYSISGGGHVSLKHKPNEVILTLLDKDFLKSELESQDSDWRDIRNSLILSAAQSNIKKIYFNSRTKSQEELQQQWDYILKMVGEVNNDLITKTIDEMLTVIL